MTTWGHDPSIENTVLGDAQLWQMVSSYLTCLTVNYFHSGLVAVAGTFEGRSCICEGGVAGVLEGGGRGVVGFCLSNYQWQLNPQESSGGISQLLLFDTAGTKKRSATLTLWTSCCKAVVLTTMPAVAHSGGKFDWKLILPQILTFSHFFCHPKDMNFEDQVLSNPDIWPWP